MQKTSSLQATRDYYKPFSYPWAFEAFQASEQMHWLWTEVPMLDDVKDWQNRLSKDEQDFLTKIFRFFRNPERTVETLDNNLIYLYEI